MTSAPRTSGDSLTGSAGAESTASPAPARRGRLLTGPVLAWGLWDWGSSAFNAVITTFVFTVYLTSSSFGDKADNETALSVGLAVSGFLIAVLAPVTGQRSDREGRTVFWLGTYTAAVVAISAALFFVRPAPDYLWLGIVLLGLGNVFFELASVNYNGILSRLTTTDRIGAVSGLGWGMGYLGGIVLLLILLVGFIQPEVGWFGVTSADGMKVRVAMLVAAAWFGLFAVPVVVTQSGRRGRRRRLAVIADEVRGRDRNLTGLESEPTDAAPARLTVVRRESIWASYRRLWRTLVGLFRSHPEVLWFLLAAAVFRDGLAGTFTYGGVVAQNTFGFSNSDVIVFAIVANVVAGATTIATGRLDDLLGPRRVIMGSLVLLVLAGLGVFFLHNQGRVAFWILGLVLSGCVGPAQSAARSFLARVIPEGREGEIFGLYATTGRAVSFVAPMMYGFSVWLGGRVVGEGSQYWGILGIVLVLVVGLLLMLRVKDPSGTLQTKEAERAS